MNTKCKIISEQLSKLLSHRVFCKYDETENIVYAHVFNVDFSKFDDVESKVFKYSNTHFEDFGLFCVPVIFTPKQTLECFPQYAEVFQFPYSKFSKYWKPLRTDFSIIIPKNMDEEFAYSA